MDTKQIIKLSVAIILAVFIMKTLNKNKRDRDEKFENFTNNVEDFTVSSDVDSSEDNPEPENATPTSKDSSSSEDNPEPEGATPETSGVKLSAAALACGDKQTVLMDYDPNNHVKNKENITTILTTVIEKLSKDENEKTENKKKIITLLDLFNDSVYTDCDFLKKNYHDTVVIKELCTHLFIAYNKLFQNPDSFKISMKCARKAINGQDCLEAVPESTDVNVLTEFDNKKKDARDIVKLLQQNSSLSMNMEEKEIKLPEKNGEQVPGCYVLEKTGMNATCDINGKDEWFSLMTKEDIDADPLMAEKVCERKYKEKVKSCGLKNSKKVMVRTKKQKKAIKDFKTADISWEDAKINYKKKLIERTTVPGCYVFHPDADCEPIVRNWELSKNNDDIKNEADVKVSREKCKKEIVHHSKVCDEKKLRKRKDEQVCKDYRTNKDNVLAKGINFVTSLGKSIQTEAKLKEYCNEKFDSIKFYESKYIKTSQQRRLEQDKIREMDKSLKAKQKKKIKEDGTVLGFVKGLWKKSTTKQKLMAGGGLLAVIIIIIMIIFGGSGKSLEKD